MAIMLTGLVLVAAVEVLMRTHGVYSIDELRFIIRPLLRSYGMDSACLFGSYARGEADGSSDIDIILVGGEHLTLSTFSVLRKIFDV